MRREKKKHKGVFRLDSKHEGLISEFETFMRGNKECDNETMRSWINEEHIKLVKARYDERCQLLNLFYSETSKRTPSEFKFEKLLKKYRIAFKRNFWFGNTNMDFYLPRYKLAIEIDGKIHEGYFKMLKDEWSDTYRQKHKIFTKHIENNDVNRVFDEILKSIQSKELKALDTRGTNRMLRKVYTET